MAPFAARLLASFHGISETSEMRDKSSESRACAQGKRKRAKKKKTITQTLNLKVIKTCGKYCFLTFQFGPVASDAAAAAAAARRDQNSAKGLSQARFLLSTHPI